MSEMPTQWRVSSLGNVAQYINGATFRPSDWGDVGTPIIRIQNLTDTTKPLNCTERVVSESLRVQNGDILVSWSATLDAFIWQRGEAWLNQHIFRVIPNDRVIRKKFLFFLLKQEIARLVDTDHLHGSTMKHINRGPFLAHKILLPPLDEQDRIIDKLNDLFAHSRSAREELTRVPSLVERYKQAVINTAFHGELTAKWRDKHGESVWENLTGGDLFTWTSGKFLPKKNQNSGAVPVFGGNGVNGSHSTPLVTHPTLVVGRVGALCGNVYLTSGPAWITDNAIYAKTVSPKISVHYARLVLSSVNLNSLAGGTGQPYVNQSTLNAVAFKLPSLAEQQEIVRRIDATFASIGSLAAEQGRAFDLLDRLDKATLSKAFRGELVSEEASRPTGPFRDGCLSSSP